MEDFRSKSYGNARIQNQIEPYSCSGTASSSAGVRDMRDLRCYSASYASSAANSTQSQMGNGVNYKFKKGRSTNSSSSKSWSFADPELQRKKRVASYKVYAAEGKLKGSLRKSFKWLKDKYARVVYGL
ncbi:uncharacterized protein LOC114751946 [Neltuma alba]|uniref:uncharacterized protein LOC114711292 n=1 Tax=Neltuma alba TaxID=207710 RepID=UPI0010A41E48|nr:uncharacterized protein LOC114711292 [Prosopis alba]XP_028796491.1 uncharacterized protein LOC114751946 [Prosopis alba]